MNLVFDIFAVTLIWLGLGILGAIEKFNKLRRVLLLLSALASFALLIIGSLAILQTLPITLQTSLGVFGFPISFSLDALSAFFLVLTGAASFGISLFAADYFRHSPKRFRLICFYYHLFLASIVWVFIAADAYSFMLAWELMAISSYFLVVGYKEDTQARHAGFLYLVIAHLGALALLAGFFIVLQQQPNFSFFAIHNAHLTHWQINLAFLLFFIGFGAKAGLLPLHVWLPEAHPAAPSPVSALMSGVLLKTAIYGLMRFCFILLPVQSLGWGIIVLIVGLLTALLGVILAAMQTDMKKLLAYSSIENIGIIVMGLGLAMIFHAQGYNTIAALALVAALFHAFNHALFKSLLFLGTGSVLHATGERNLGKLGGLIKTMPWVAALVLIGVLATAGLPPFNGFVSEWLLIQAFLFFPKFGHTTVSMILPLAAAGLVLAIGLAAYVMVKFYGIIFLGRPRETELAHATDAGLLERLGLVWLGMLCVIVGVFPVLVLHFILPAIALWIPTLPLAVFNHHGFLIPTDATRASYNPLIIFALLLLLTLTVYILFRYFSRSKSRRVPAWDCGFPWQTSRMQDTAEGFGQPIKNIFSLFLHIRMQLPSAFDKSPHYSMIAEDRFWYALYLPLARLVGFCSQIIAKLQQGKIAYYLLYSFITLLILWWWLL